MAFASAYMGGGDRKFRHDYRWHFVAWFDIKIVNLEYSQSSLNQLSST